MEQSYRHTKQRFSRLLKKTNTFLIIGFAVIGVTALAVSGAATSFVSLEAESGEESGLAEEIVSTNASGGSAVEFGARSQGSGSFRIVEGNIVDPEGKRFVPIGANVGANVFPEAVSWCYAFARDVIGEECANAEGHSDEALEWGWNMIRVNTTIDHGPGATLQKNIDAVQRLIDEYTPKKIVVMPTIHSGRITGKDLPMSDSLYTEINAFWDAIIERNKNNTYVWVNYVNEPSADPVKTGENGGGDTFWRTLGDQQYQRVRQRGNNMFVYDLPIYGQQIQELAEVKTGDEFLQGKQNVTFSWHNYGGAIKFDQGWAHGTYQDMTRWADAVKAKKLPVIMGEFGRSSLPNTPANVHGNGEDVDRSADWTFDTWWTYGFGALWWHGTGTGENWDLRMNGRAAWFNESQPLSASGQRLKDIPAQRPSAY